MKRVIFATVLLAILSTASFAKKPVAEGKTNSALGNYRIEQADNSFILNGTDCKTYKITYENTPMDVTVVVWKDKEKKCMKYFVLSDKLSVQYVCNKSYFGVERLDKAIEKEGHKTSDRYLNRAEYFRQKVLNSGELSETESTMFVAAYFPFLLNDSGIELAVK